MDKSIIIDAVILRKAEIEKEVIHHICHKYNIKSIDGVPSIPAELVNKLILEICNEFSSRMLIDVLVELLSDTPAK